MIRMYLEYIRHRIIYCFRVSVGKCSSQLEVNVMVLWLGLELLSVHGGRFEINQLLFADDIALVADSDEKLRVKL